MPDHQTARFDLAPPTTRELAYSTTLQAIERLHDAADAIARYLGWTIAKEHAGLKRRAPGKQWHERNVRETQAAARAAVDRAADEWVEVRRPTLPADVSPLAPRVLERAREQMRGLRTCGDLKEQKRILSNVLTGIEGFSDAAIEWILDRISHEKTLRTLERTLLPNEWRMAHKLANKPNETIAVCELEYVSGLSHGTHYRTLQSLVRKKVVRYPDGDKGGVALTGLGWELWNLHARRLATCQLAARR